MVGKRKVDHNLSLCSEVQIFWPSLLHFCAESSLVIPKGFLPHLRYFFSSCSSSELFKPLKTSKGLEETQPIFSSLLIRPVYQSHGNSQKELFLQNRHIIPFGDFRLLNSSCLFELQHFSLEPCVIWRPSTNTYWNIQPMFPANYLLMKQAKKSAGTRRLKRKWLMMPLSSPQRDWNLIFLQSPRPIFVELQVLPFWPQETKTDSNCLTALRPYSIPKWRFWPFQVLVFTICASINMKPVLRTFQEFVQCSPWEKHQYDEHDYGQWGGKRKFGETGAICE